MRKYGQDCDGSGVIDCDDFARIHKLGFGSCGGDAIYNTDYWQKYDVCYFPNSQPETAREFPAFPGNQPGNVAEPANYDYGDGTINARNVHN